MLCYLLAMGGDVDDLPQIMLLPSDSGPSWVEIGGLIVAGLGVVVTIVTIWMKMKGNKE